MRKQAGSAACHLASKQHQSSVHPCLQEGVKRAREGELWPAACLPDQRAGLILPPPACRMEEGEIEREGWGLLLARLASELQRMGATPAELLLDQAMRTMLPQASKLFDRRKEVGSGWGHSVYLKPECGLDLLEMLPCCCSQAGRPLTRCHLDGRCLACSFGGRCLACSSGE